ncbi:MAG: thymidylate synthase [Candidatus Binatia bacterium]
MAESRVGPVWDFGPAVYELEPGGSKFCILRGRRFNPFFALAEASWVLAGDNRLAPLEFYLPRFREFSDDGVVLEGAYGFRLRRAYGRDQLQEAAELLAADASSRRVVLSTWGVEDLGRSSRDIPCNTTVYFKIREQRLDMMVCNRSNDAYLGVPYNVVTFAILQAYVATAVGVGIGRQTHVTDSLHLYERDRSKVEEIVRSNDDGDIERIVEKVPLADLEAYSRLDHAVLTRDYSKVIEGCGLCLSVRNSFIAWKAGMLGRAVSELPPSDVSISAVEWFSKSRRFVKGWIPGWATMWF